MTLYTAIGKYEFRKDKDGNKLPVIIAEEKEYTLDIWEMILWSSLIWNIYTYDEITKIFYKKERDVHVLSDLSCDTYIDRLENAGLIVSGHGITAADALHGLLSKLYVIPVKANFLKKSAAFLHMTYIRKVPFNITKHIFDKLKFTASETKIMKLAAQNRLSVDAIKWCISNYE